MPLPGVSVPPVLMVTGPAIAPLPPSLPPLETVTAPGPVPLPRVLFTSKVPLLIETPPLKALLPVSVTTPLQEKVGGRGPGIEPGGVLWANLLKTSAGLLVALPPPGEPPVLTCSVPPLTVVPPP